MIIIYHRSFQNNQCQHSKDMNYYSFTIEFKCCSTGGHDLRQNGNNYEYFEGSRLHIIINKIISETIYS